MIGINVIHICKPKPAKYDTHAKYKNFNKIWGYVDIYS